MSNKNIDYDDKCLKEFNSDTILKTKLNILNVKLLEKPIIINDDDIEYTLLKIICNRKIKVFLKTIEKILNDDNDDNDENIRISINYDIHKNNDYYELLLNKKIEQILENININETYNICISLVDKILLWKLHSIEINDDNKLINNDLIENDINVDDFDPDYEDIINSLKKEAELIIINMNSNIDGLKKQRNELNDIVNNFEINKIQEYRELLNSYSNYLNN